MSQERVRKVVLFVLLVGISLAFLAMIRPFLLTILLSGIVAGLLWPLYSRLVRLLRGRRVLSAVITLVLLLFIIVGPLGTFVGVVVGEAVKISESIRPWVQERMNQPHWMEDQLEKLPFLDELDPYRAEIYERAGALVSGVGNWVVGSLSDVTKGTVQFLFHLGVLLYTVFFFLLDGRKMLRTILWYLPLDDEDEELLARKFTSVTRATIKGTVVIGILQGGLAGAAFAVAGIPSAVFWGTVMVVLSIIPGVGTALVWVPAAIVLAATGHWGKALLLAGWCALVVGSIDNVLRPRLVGRDTEMPDLLIFFSTLGGILLFGIVGFAVGPIVAALFVAIWEIYGHVFRDVLPEVAWLDDEGDDQASG
jgi:predicted PurR-regulated permease PerM